MAISAAVVRQRAKPRRYTRPQQINCGEPPFCTNWRRKEAIGNRTWHDLLDRHNEILRRGVLRHRGREEKTTGDGFLMALDGPARSSRCSLAISEAVEDLGWQVT